MAEPRESGSGTSSEKLANVGTERAEAPDRRDRPAPVPPPSREVTLGTTVVLAGFAVACVVAIVAAGWQYGIPFAILFLIAAGFAGLHRGVGTMKSRRTEGRLEDVDATDSEDAVPHLGFDDASSLGDTAQHPEPYTEPKSTGAR